MIRRINPYRPGAGRTPPLLAGREQPRADFERLLDTVTATGQGDRSWIMSGLRGVGKTVLLNDYVAIAGDKAWLTVKVEATRAQSLAATLTKALYVPLRKLTTQGGRVSAAWSKAVAVFSAFRLTVDPTGTYSFGVDIKPAAGTADTGELSL
ncbi:MAG: ATP-binding protein, partial [Solirubrobacterales bacterium]|nr:ATP-binding protein [Solirubrobacterales bacterium]